MQAVTLAAPPPVSVTIDGVEFEIAVLGATQASSLLAKILSALGPALDGVKGGNFETAFFAAALRALTPELVSELCRTFGSVCRVTLPGGQRMRISDVFDTFFAGRMGLLRKWLTECLRVNYSDFLDGVPGIGGRASGPTSGTAQSA